jgi:integrase
MAEEFSRRVDIAPKSRIFYRDSLRMTLLPFCDREGLTRPEELTPEVIDRLAIELEGRLSRQGNPLSPATRRSYLKAVQQFLSWLERRKKVSGVEARLVQMPGLRRKHRDVLMRQEIQLLEDAAPMERNKLLIRLMGDTGAREGEVASLRLEDLVAKERSYFIRIRGKTGERMPPITPSVYRRLKAYAEGKSGRPRTRSTYLFLTSRRRPGGGHEPLTESGVYQAVKDAVERSGIGRRAYPHLLRHSAITHMVSGGMHPALVSDITGVSVAVIAQHYSHPTDEQRYHALMRVLDEPG